MSDYRSLQVWTIADQFAAAVYMTRTHVAPRDRFTIGDQLWRAALSVPCNIVEGYSRDSAKQLLYHLNVALASLNEALYLIDLATRLGAIDGAAAGSAVGLGVQLQPRLAAFARTVRNGRSRHSRFPSAAPHQRA